MTTRAIVPNGDGEGSLGTVSAKWGAIYSSDPASGENSGRVPTTAWVQKLLADALAKQKTAYEQAISTAVTAAKTQAKLDAHPVGSYYWSNDSTSPSTLFGGTWEALPPGYTLIAQGSGTDEYGSFTYTAGQKYGERKHPLTTDELPHCEGYFGCDVPRNHTHFCSGVFSGTTVAQQGNIGQAFDNSIIYGYRIAFGNDKPHTNLPLSVCAYCWKRTA